MIAVNTTADHHEYALTVYDIDKKISVNYQPMYLFTVGWQKIRKLIQ